MDTKERFHIIMRKHSESAWAKAPVKASTGKAVQQENGSKIKNRRIGGERKEFTNGTTGEACLAKPSVERLPKAKTPFRVLPYLVLLDGCLSFFPGLRISQKNDLRNSQWEIPPCHRGASVTIHSIRRARGVRGGSVCLPVSGEAIRRSRASPDSIYTVKQAPI